jgi:hypothetical protein
MAVLMHDAEVKILGKSHSLHMYRTREKVAGFVFSVYCDKRAYCCIGQIHISYTKRK